MFDRFTEEAMRVIMHAEAEAQRLERDYVGTEMVLLALLDVRTCLAARALHSVNVSLKETRIQIDKLIGPRSEITKSMSFTPRLRRLLEYSVQAAKQLSHEYIGTEHLLLGLLWEARDDSSERRGCAIRVLEALEIDLVELESQLVRRIQEKEELSLDFLSQFGNASAYKEQLSTELTEEALNAILISQLEARKAGKEFVGTEWILLGLLNEHSGIAYRVLKLQGVESASVALKLKDYKECDEQLNPYKEKTSKGFALYVRERTEKDKTDFPMVNLDSIRDRLSFGSFELPFTSDGKRLLKGSQQVAFVHGQGRIGSEHLLLALLHTVNALAFVVLEELGVDTNLARKTVMEHFEHN